MKRLVLVRHGKAEQFDYENDFTRNLTDRGVRDAGKIGKMLAGMGIIPDLIISSPANRAIQTAQIYAENLNYSPEKIREEEDLYEGITTQEFIRLVQHLPDKLEVVYFFGHNPGFQVFASNLMREFNYDFPTCATIGIDFSIDSWEMLRAKTGKKAFFLSPKIVD